MAYIERAYLTEQFENLLHDDNMMCPIMKVLDALEIIDTAPSADVEEKKDCEKCIHFGKHATEYPCSHCRNCYTDKFQPNDTRTPKERGSGE